MEVASSEWAVDWFVRVESLIAAGRVLVFSLWSYEDVDT